MAPSAQLLKICEQFARRFNFKIISCKKNSVCRFGSLDLLYCSTPRKLSIAPTHEVQTMDFRIRRSNPFDCGSKIRFEFTRHQRSERFQPHRHRLPKRGLRQCAHLQYICWQQRGLSC